jgi:hypothetical protein
MQKTIKKLFILAIAFLFFGCHSLQHSKNEVVDLTSRLKSSKSNYEKIKLVKDITNYCVQLNEEYSDLDVLVLTVPSIYSMILLSDNEEFRLEALTQVNKQLSMSYEPAFYGIEESLNGACYMDNYDKRYAAMKKSIPEAVFLAIDDFVKQIDQIQYSSFHLKTL